MYIDITEYKRIAYSKKCDSILKFWSMKSHESEIFRDYKINISYALRFEELREYKKSKIYFDKCYEFAKQMGDLSGIFDCISGLTRIANKQKNLKALK